MSHALAPLSLALESYVYFPEWSASSIPADRRDRFGALPIPTTFRKLGGRKSKSSKVKMPARRAKALATQCSRCRSAGCDGRRLGRFRPAGPATAAAPRTLERVDQAAHRPVGSNSPFGWSPGRSAERVAGVDAPFAVSFGEHKARAFRVGESRRRRVAVDVEVERGVGRARQRVRVETRPALFQ